ncbi:MAG: riboflavin synthase [Nitrospiraceae bacterium]|nr:riboflavin synthase [Nitrospiraceae bacterium]
MFTGLVLGLGSVSGLVRKNGGARLSVDAGNLAVDAEIGDSIAVNGTCLTVVEIRGSVLSFDISDETLRSSNVGRLQGRDRVNLEPSLRPNAKMGGHFVTGHIDGVGTIRSKVLTGDVYRIIIDVSPKITGYLVGKGSVAIDGISLTVVDVAPESFSLVVIPHTALMTTLGFKAAGDTVNIEVDILGKYVAKFLGRDTGRADALMDTLVREGFA